MTDDTPMTENAVEKLPENAAISGSAGLPQDELHRLTDDIIAGLKTVYDPEIPADIYELGLIYDLDVHPDGKVDIRMTLTSPMCPVAGSLPPEVETKVNAVPGVTNVSVELVWEPPWTPELMSPEARMMLGL